MELQDALTYLDICKLKLSAYAADQLPGGRYWDADSQTKDVLRELQLSNDVCESILGLYKRLSDNSNTQFTPNDQIKPCTSQEE